MLYMRAYNASISDVIESRHVTMTS